jgi:MoaA/NifB/PqqE/SkfB family radical SAM enzyme
MGELAVVEVDAAYPTLEFERLDTLWLQVTGTLCNLACLHCLISCGPKNDQHPFMTLEQVLATIEEGARRGIKELYFTGGEPFMHEQIREMIEAALKVAPLTILTNGMLIDEEMAAWLAAQFKASRYSLDLRVSLDGASPEENDAIRGRKTFWKIVESIERLWSAGLNPIITVTTCHAEAGGEEGRLRFVELLRSVGITKPRLKFMSPFKIGREESRHGAEGGYRPYERLYESDLVDGGGHLQCGSCRVVTARGVWPCPILINVDAARMGDVLEDGMQAIQLDHSACYTCHVEGVSCKT